MKNLLTLAVLLVTAPFLLSQSIDMSAFHGMTPRSIGPAGMSGRVTAIDVDLSDIDNIFIGAAAGGVWKSENAGHTWTPIFDDQSAASIGDIEIYQKNPNIIYVGTGEGNPRNSQNSGRGIFKTIDGGRTWKGIGLENTRQIHRIIIHPDNPDVVVVGVSGATWGDSEDRGIYKTIDGGQTWKKVLYINNRTGAADLIVDPSNPNKMFAAMWEHRRWPWFFKSGGAGSGLYMSNDGGDTWQQVNHDNLPKGEIGRIGLSIAPSNPNYVYAYIESSSNAIYRSTDGGYTWERRSKPKDSKIGGRPFYYADIYVDSQNENRVYSIASEVTQTEDGGKTWKDFAPGNRIHTDHHAFWVHPTDPEHIMIGHDGGLNITHDRGNKWWFADNLPLAQFYHVRVDNEVPYNVMGGLQDNGSWVGPSQVFFKGGIRNFYWQRVSVGDGFDVVPDPIAPDYGYSMGQAGNLVRYHRPSGHLKKIKPVHPDGEFLRFNWNAGIAIDPHDNKTIYYGSQYLHKSSDHGSTWDIISPDLTTDDPEKQKWLETGGLTYDVTGAENHTTIITIDPSPLQKDVIWVGTDDGNIQVTQDGGQNWNKVNIKGIPTATWVTQITASTYNVAEAFAVLDDHRRDNWTPYVYHTKDFGKTWRPLVNSNNIDGYVYSFTQDPIEPNLMFIGAEFGLFVSFDSGVRWQKWTIGLPNTPISDLVIHPRDHDLVIGTFGRSFYILDDIRPLRAIAAQNGPALLEKQIHVFDIPDTYQWMIGESIGYRQGKVGDSYYNGENRPIGALISYQASQGGEATFHITNTVGDTIRTYFQKAKKGINRYDWNLRADAVRAPNRAKAGKQARSGFYVAPGTYTCHISMNGQSSSDDFQVKADPRMAIVSENQLMEKTRIYHRYNEIVNQATAAMDDIRSIESNIEIVQSLLKKKKNANLEKEISDLKKELKLLNNKMLGEEKQGIYRKPDVINSMIGRANYALDFILVPTNQNQINLLDQLEASIQIFQSELDSLKSSKMMLLKSFDKERSLNLFE